MNLGKTFKIFVLTVLFISVTFTTMSRLPLIMSSPDQAELPTDKPSVFFHNGTVYNKPFIAKVNDTITIALVIFNLTKDLETGNLTGFDIQISWDPTVLKYVNYTNPDPEIGGYRHPNVTVPVEKYPDPVPPSPYAGILHEEVFKLKNIVNESASIPGAEPGTMAWFAYSTLPGAEPFSGNGTFFTMTFKVLKRGSSPLKLTKVDLSGEGLPPIHLSYQAFDGVFRTADAPIAEFTFWPSVGVENKSVIFNASASYSPIGTNISKYIWDFGDGNITTVTTPIVSHVYNMSGDYTVSLVVEDSDGIRSSAETKHVSVVEKRNVKVDYVSPFERDINVVVNDTVEIEVKFTNDGGAEENFMVRAYYNATAVNQTDISATDWILIGEENASLPVEVEGKKRKWDIIHFTWNTTGVTPDASYTILANITLVPYEENVNDNNMISNYVVNVRSTPLRDVIIEKLEFGWSETFKSPVLEGEKTTFQITVLNYGTENETAVNVTLYYNDLMLKSWNESIPTQKAVKLTYEEILDPNYYNITALATIENDEYPDNNRKEGILHVIRTPQLNFTYNPKEPYVNQTVIFNASASLHREPGASITDYQWQIYNPAGTLVKTFPFDPHLINITYQFGAEGEWRVVLSVRDNYGIEPKIGGVGERVATSAYQVEARIDVRAVPTGFPIEYLVLAIVLIVVVIILAVMIYRRRRKA